MGKKVWLVSQNSFVGGMTSGGLTATDVGKPTSIGGMAIEYYERLGKKVDFSPTLAEETYLKMLAEAGVTVIRNGFLESVVLKDGKLVSATMLTGEVIQAKVFVDSTYEGDLFAAAGVSYRVGREPRSGFGESIAGRWQQLSWRGVYQFCGLTIDPYVKAGNPESGLLPEIGNEAAGKPGDGDNQVQAYNFRMFLSNRDGKIPFPKPAGYDADRYRLLARFMESEGVDWKLNYTVGKKADGPVQMRNGDSNNAGSFSSDLVGGNYRWPDGTYEPGSFAEMPAPRRGLPMSLRDLYELREKIFQDHVTYQQGLMYFLANDERVPASLRERVNHFGLDPNEFKTSGYWPHHLYVREGRRMVSDYVMTQANCELKNRVEDSIGLASYPMDSHFCQRVVVKEEGQVTVRNEGGLSQPCAGAYGVSYRSIVPKKSECANLLVPVCLSATHIAYGSIRMEPVFMILGQSAGTAASLAVDMGVAVQDVPYSELKSILLKGGQKLE
jgi:hypothetical protein